MVALAVLSQLELRYDGPFPAEAALEAAEQHAFWLAEAEQARRFFAARAHRTLGHARRHRSQGRRDLYDLMLRDFSDYRAGFRFWNRRARALRADT